MADDDPYEYKEEGGKRLRRRKDNPMNTAWEDDPGGRGIGAVKSDLGYKAGGSDAKEDLSDEAIAKLSPLMRASAIARRKRLSAEQQAGALKPSPSPSPAAK